MTHEHCDGCPSSIIGDLSSMFGELMSDVFPEEAHHHLRNAERELLLAVAVTFEYHANKRSPQPKEGEEAPPPPKPVKIKLDD
ncbi:MAG: hypothetical protein ACP5OR_01545 [Candidatus Dormibacteria bacterium]